MKYVIYLRVSTTKQDETPQARECLNFLKNHHNGEFEHVIFKDNITSQKRIFLENEEIDKHKAGRKKGLRPGIQLVLDTLEKGDVLVATRLDRISRIPYETHRLQNLLMKKEVGILLVHQPGINDPLLMGIYAGLAAKETEVLKARIKEKLNDKKARNERTTYQVPYGFTIHPSAMVNIKNRDGPGWTMKPGLLIPEPFEQTVLDLMCRSFDEGKTYRQITRLLNDQGYKNRAGNPFQNNSVYRILARTGRTRSWDQVLEATRLQTSHLSQ